MSISIHFY